MNLPTIAVILDVQLVNVHCAHSRAYCATEEFQRDGLGLPDDDIAYGSALWPDGHEHAHSGLDGTLTL